MYVAILFLCILMVSDFKAIATPAFKKKSISPEVGVLKQFNNDISVLSNNQTKTILRRTV